MLTVYKASAGSGKTFQLVVEYIRLLIENPHNYKRILAVTFTNKATNEMKTRILEQLNILATGKPSDYIQHLGEDNNFSEVEIRKNAKIALKNILHDYNRFSVSTIDSFTQRTIKAFNRELGISPNFTLELDNEMVLAEATDRLIANIGNDKKLLKWLQSFSKEKIEDNRSQRIEHSIKSLGLELFKEKFQVFFSENGELVYSRKNLKWFGKELNRILKIYENKLIELGKKGTEIIENNGLTVDDFSGKSRGIGSQFEKYAKGLLPNVTQTVETCAVEIEAWYTKNSPLKDQIHDLVERELQPLLVQIIDFVDKNKEEYYTALAIKKQFRTLGILTDLKGEIRLLLQEKGLLQLSDANLLLNKIIGNSDSPFIYEKTGNYFHHFMLDEFQDTSELQWLNFKPLINNSLAEGNKNLLVGDVKQSIYRWRNSNWNILAEKVNQDFRKNQRLEKPLNHNWRSDKNIIDFNNSIFENLKEVFEEIQFRAVDDPGNILIEKFRNVYHSFAQSPGKNKKEKKGLVKIRFLPKEDFEENSLELLVEQIKELQDAGILASEIAILIRTNKEGTPIIQQFLEASGKPENEDYNLTVLSNESLFLFASQGALMIINVIKLLIEPENEITRVALLNQWMNCLKPELNKKGIPTNSTDSFQFSFDEYLDNSWIEHFNHLFEAELSEKLREIKEKVISSSLDEIIIQIASIFQLIEIETELPYIQTLIDKAGELKTSLSNDLSNLLFWWNEKGYKTSVNVNDEVDSIRLLTVHKAKGLEFKAVLIPFFNWRTSNVGQYAPIHWVQPQMEPFNAFPLLPVKHESNLKDSQFKKEYNEEVVNTFIDVFNLVYVAFTRAKSVLMVHCPEVTETKGESSSGKSVNYLLFKSLEKLINESQFAQSFNTEKTIFRFGEITVNEKVEKTSSSIIVNNYAFNDFSKRIQLRSTGDDFLIAGKEEHSVKNTGKIIHEILAGIETSADVKSACRNAFYEGKINEVEESEIRNKLEEELQKPQIKEWFDGSYTVLNERSLLKTNDLLRPDRIMISGKNAVVVDYKTGESKSENYHWQVKRYAKTLRESGLDKVEGYIWYIQLNEVERVCEY